MHHLVTMEPVDTCGTHRLSYPMVVSNQCRMIIIEASRCVDDLTAGEFPPWKPRQQGIGIHLLKGWFYRLDLAC